MMPLVGDATGNQLTYRIISAAMAVHNRIGPGYKEEVYEKALEIEINLTKDERAQVINSLKATGVPVASLFNCGRRALEYHRIFPGRDDRMVQRLGRDDVRKGQRG